MWKQEIPLEIFKKKKNKLAKPYHTCFTKKKKESHLKWDEFHLFVLAYVYRNWLSIKLSYGSFCFLREAAKRLPPMSERNRKKTLAAKAAKEDGNRYFKEGNYELALKIYDRVSEKKTIRFKTNPSFCAFRIDFEGQPIFVVQWRLLYEKSSIFDEEYDGIKIK